MNDKKVIKYIDLFWYRFIILFKSLILNVLWHVIFIKQLVILIN